MEHINKFREFFASKLIILLDAYDEASCEKIRDCSLFGCKTKLGDWRESKFIITCRLSAEVMNEHNYWDFFSEKKEDMVEIRLNSFNIDQRKELFKNFSKKYRLPIDWTLEKLNEIIEKNETLSNIKQTPFNLKVIYQVLPQSMLRNKNDIDEIKLMEAYIDLCIDRGKKKIKAASKKIKNFKKRVIEYCKSIASLMIKNKSNSIKYEYGDEGLAASLLNRDQENIRELYDSSPLINFNENTYGFISFEIFEYFEGLVQIDEFNNKEKNEDPLVENTANNQATQNIYITENKLSNKNLYTVKMLKNNPDLQLKIIISLKNSNNKKHDLDILYLLVEVSLRKPNIGDRENIDVEASNQIAITLLGQFTVISFKDGSIKAFENNQEYDIRKPCSYITRILIASNRGKYLLGLSDHKVLTLYYLKSFDAIIETSIVENVTWLTTSKFSDDDSKLFVAFQNAEGDTVLVYKLKEREMIPFKIEEKFQEIQDIILSPGNSEHFIILKEFSNFDIYQNENKVTCKIYSSGELDFSDRIIQKIKIFAKCNSSLTTTNLMFERLKMIETDGIALDKSTNEQIREIYVNLQGAFEQLFAHFLEKKNIVKFIGGIHTELPASPLCTNLSTSNSKSLIRKEMRLNIKQVLMIEARANIINILLNMPCVNFHCIYPKKNKREEPEMQIYKANLDKYTNLYDNPLDIKEDSFNDKMNGATYLFKHKDGEWYCFSLQGKQAFQNDLNVEWCIWFGSLRRKRILTRAKEVAEYFSNNGFVTFSKELDEIEKEISVLGNYQ